MIKAFTYVFLFISAVLLLSNCEEENANPRSYPRVNTLPVTNITEKGASFKAELYSLGTEKIINHGFVWSMYDPSVVYSNKIFLGPCDSTGTYQANIVTSLRKGIKYTVKPFVQTADHIVYGVPVIFISLGSEAPVIYSFEPHTAGWMDTLTIKGKNFSWVAGENVVKLNKTICPTMTSTDSVLQVMVDSELPDLKSILSVDLAGNVAVHTADTFRLLVPTIGDFFPKQVRWGDTITVTGNRFLNERLSSYITATLGGFTCNILEKKKESFKLLVPLDIAAENNHLSVKIQNQIYSLPDKVSLLAPLISEIRPKEGTWGTEVTLKGIFHPFLSRNAISIGGYTASIISNTKDSIRVKIPQYLSTVRNVFLNNSSPFIVASTDTFKLFGPVIESITPLSGISGMDILIKGKYFSGYYNTTVKFGAFDAYIVEVSNTYIKCRVPTELNNGPVKITVNTNSQNFTFGQDFIVTNPYVTRVSPLTGTFNDLITVEGQYLTSGIYGTYFYFKTETWVGVSAEIVSKMPNSLVVKVPSSLDSIPKQMMIQVGPGTVIYSGSFILKPPSISFVSAAGIAPGTDITISGSNFNPVISGNKVFLGTYQLTVKSSTASQIVATVPVGIANGNYRISINVGGYKRIYPDVYNIKSSWSSVSIPGSLNWNSGRGTNESGMASSAKGTGYIMDFVQSRMTAFNPVGNSFSDLGSHDYKHFGSGMSTVVNNDTLCLIGGDTGFYWYSPSMFMWVYNRTVPTTLKNGVSFSLYGQIYHGLNYDLNSSSLDRKLWVFDQGNKSWISKNNFPGLSLKNAVAYFTINNKGYVLFADRIFCEYNPDTDSWRKLSSFPGPARFGMISFVINNKGYAGLGTYSIFSGTPYDDIWVYDPALDSWTISTYMPNGGRYNSISFVVNDKAYIGFGYKSSIQQNDLYEYDPNFVAK